MAINYKNPTSPENVDFPIGVTRTDNTGTKF